VCSASSDTVIVVADSGNNVVRAVHSAQYSASASYVTTVAGTSVSAFVDGSGSQARFSAPSALACSSDNTVGAPPPNPRRLTLSGRAEKEQRYARENLKLVLCV
jgi:hypothetical protein